ncbi:hypothetical protein C8Q73DRAFT_705673 [Cubamyces lactineus]|nr:hypothetical protein C8Q73DRAFT_705673 [Cubamyces lactineus]
MDETVNPGPGKAGPSLGLEGLPLELSNVVFEHMATEKASLATCTLVSRGWRDIALPHLFRSVEGVQQTALSDFVHFLDARPRIPRLIRTLRINGISGISNNYLPGVVSLETLTALTAKLPSLQKLFLHKVFFADTPADPSNGTVTGAVASARRLDQLVVHGCFDESKPERAVSLPALLGMLDAFPADSTSLHSLMVADVPPSDPLMARVLNPPERLRVCELTLSRLTSRRRPHHDEMGHLYDALRHVVAPGCLRSLRARVERDTAPESESMQPFGSLVHYAARTLLPFALRHPVLSSEDNPEYWCALHLRECRHLRSFTLWIEPPLLRSLSTARGTPNRQHIPLSAMIVAILSHLPPTLHTLTLALCDAVEPAHIRSAKLGLRVLDDALSDARRFPSLATVRVLLGDSQDEQDEQDDDDEPPIDLHKVSQAVREEMPSCARRGVLVVELESKYQLVTPSCC